MYRCDWANNIFLPMVTCTGCMLAKLQAQSLFSLTTMPHKQNAYKVVLRNLHWHRPNSWVRHWVWMHFLTKTHQYCFEIFKMK